MPIRKIRCIRIVHSENKIKLYRMLSGFFRLMGIFVCENIKGRESLDEKDWSYEVPSDSEEAEEDLKKDFKNAWKEVAGLLGNGIQEVFEKLAEIYLEYELMRGSYAIAYFANAGDKDIYQYMTDFRTNFADALDQLSEFEKARGEDAPGNIYIWAAKANCKRRICELHTIVWNAVDSGICGESEEERQLHKRDLLSMRFYRFQELNEDICKILKKDPEFYGAYAIRGLAMELYRNEKIDSVNELKKAVAIIGKESNASYLYYRIGRNYEMFWPNLSVEMEYYKLAWEVDKNNYRALYKLARFEQKQNKLEKAIQLWITLINILKCKKDRPSLQPIECAYLYKSYRNLGNLYIEVGKMSEGLESLESAVSVYDSKMNEKDGFYGWMFSETSNTKENKKERWEIYKDAAKKKLGIEDIYIDIIKVAAQMNWKKIYNKYSKMRYRSVRLGI